MLAFSAKSDAAAAEDAARAAAAAEAGGVNVRRSTRAVKNRVIMVRQNGHFPYHASVCCYVWLHCHACITVSISGNSDDQQFTAVSHSCVGAD